MVMLQVTWCKVQMMSLDPVKQQRVKTVKECDNISSCYAHHHTGGDVKSVVSRMKQINSVSEQFVIPCAGKVFCFVL